MPNGMILDYLKTVILRHMFLCKLHSKGCNTVKVLEQDIMHTCNITGIGPDSLYKATL